VLKPAQEKLDMADPLATAPHSPGALCRQRRDFHRLFKMPSWNASISGAVPTVTLTCVGQAGHTLPMYTSWLP